MNHAETMAKLACLRITQRNALTKQANNTLMGTGIGALAGAGLLGGTDYLINRKADRAGKLALLGALTGGVTGGGIGYLADGSALNRLSNFAKPDQIPVQYGDNVVSGASLQQPLTAGPASHIAGTVARQTPGAVVQGAGYGWDARANKKINAKTQANTDSLLRASDTGLAEAKKLGIKFEPEAKKHITGRVIGNTIAGTINWMDALRQTYAAAKQEPVVVGE